MSEGLISLVADQMTSNQNGGFHNENSLEPDVCEGEQSAKVDQGDFSEDAEEEYIFKSPCFSLKLKDVDRAYSTSTLLLNGTDTVAKMPNCYPHRGIELNESMKVGTGSSWPLRLLDLHFQNLGEFIKSNKMPKQLDWADRVLLIKELTKAIQHIHGFNKQHGNLSVECISISCDGRNRPFIWNAERPPLSESTCDVKSLGKIGYFILTNGVKYTSTIDKEKIYQCFRLGFTQKQATIMSREPIETAHDLLASAINGDVKIDDITDHPFFWFDSKKATFICDLFDSLGANKEAFGDVERLLETEMFDGNWIKKLRILSAEKNALPRGNVNMDLFVNKAEGKSIKIDQYRINDSKLQQIRVVGANEKKWKTLKKSSMKEVGEFKTLSDEHEWLNDDAQCAMFQNVVFRKVDVKPAYDKSSLYDLIRFVRNRKVHCYECPKGSDSNQEMKYYELLGGYWNFYSARFPRLLLLLYKHLDLFPFYKGHSMPVN